MLKKLPLLAVGLALLISSFATAAPPSKETTSAGKSHIKARKAPPVRRAAPKPGHVMTPGMKMPKK